MLNTKQTSELKKLLSSKLKIAVTSHNNPDGDAIGSLLAMKRYLIKLGHDVTGIVPNNFPGFLSWLPGSEQIIIYKLAAKEAQKAILEADLIFSLDYNAINRFGPAAEIILRSKAKRILIDHHINPEKESFDFCFSTTETSSTGELIYDFIDLLGDKNLIDREIAEAIYTGIVTDTGSFSFAANNQKTYLVTAELVAEGVDAQKIHRLVYDTFSEDRLRLLGHAISNNMLVWSDLHTALIYLAKEDLIKYNYQVGDIEGIVNYPLMMDQVNMSVLLTERDNQIRLSFRSKGEFSVNQLTRDYFNGGGHKNAAGGRSNSTMVETINTIKEVVSKYKEALDYRITY